MFTVSASTFLVALSVLVAASLLRTDGHLVYTLDDPYIHLAVARTLAFQHTYGVTAGSYESASSSPGWVMLLAILLLVAPAVALWLPLVLNIFVALWLLHTFWVRQRLLMALPPGAGVWLIATLLPLALFVPALAMTGMEHVLHALLMLQLLILLEPVSERRAAHREQLAYYLLVVLISTVRFEGMFATIGCTTALLVAGATGAAMLTLVLGAMPVLVLGVVNTAHGQYFFPNSVMAKTTLGAAGWHALVPNPGRILLSLREDVMLSAVIVLVLLLFSTALFKRRPHYSCVAYLITAGLHLSFAAVGWFDRYQAYLIICGAFLSFRLLEDVAARHPRRALVILTVALLALPWHKFVLTYQAPRASSEIYRQQYQMGRFFAEAYRGRTVAVNDLGWVAWLHDGPILDFGGLGSYAILRAGKEGRFDRAFARTLGTQQKLAAMAVYDIGFTGVIPPEWPKVAEWSLGQMPVTAPWPVVSFYAPSAEGAAELLAKLQAFESTLPAGVAVHYLR